ncbi:hypothetical protein PGT21_001461 [Puccinia graminis f. sp. tritici]|uniref:Uncharacterized protein n=1 Tax=Puccinia graminis f. sp. tritici TaxID=56615 RepID=A0A5B0Q9C4_PUCGR|nr:hypothetical protein PGT21_001461 [Puccinia graminis f. sp. tritici]
MGAADRSAAPRRSAQQIDLQPPDDLLSLGDADRSAAPRQSAQPGGCRSICSPQTISSAWGLQIDLQPPDHILSLGAADRSAAPRPYPQPGGCRSICSPQTISSAWGLQIDLQPPDDLLIRSLPYVESSRATRRGVSHALTLRRVARLDVG